MVYYPLHGETLIIAIPWTAYNTCTVSPLSFQAKKFIMIQIAKKVWNLSATCWFQFFTISDEQSNSFGHGIHYVTKEAKTGIELFSNLGLFSTGNLQRNHRDLEPNSNQDTGFIFSNVAILATQSCYVTKRLGTHPHAHVGGWFPFLLHQQSDFHILMVLSFSRAAEAIRFSVGWQAVQSTTSVCPCSFCTISLVCRFQM